MAPRPAATRALIVSAFVVVAFFVVDLVILHRMVTKERVPAPGREPADIKEPKNPGGAPGTSEAADPNAAAAEAARLRARIAELEAEAEQLRATVGERFADRETIRSEAASLRVQVDETRTALEAAKAGLAAATQRETELRNERQQIADLVAKLNADIKETNAKNDQLKADLKAAQDRAVAEKTRGDGLQKSLDEANVTLEAAKKLLDQKSTENNTLQARVTELEARVAQLEAQAGSGANPGEGQGQ